MNGIRLKPTGLSKRLFKPVFLYFAIEGTFRNIKLGSGGFPASAITLKRQADGFTFGLLKRAPPFHSNSDMSDIDRLRHIHGIIMTTGRR